MLRIEVTGEINLVQLAATSGTSWQGYEALTQQIGDQWLESAASALARISSAIMPHTWNYLLNPAHPEAEKVRIVAASDHLYDPRLLRVRAQ